MPIAAQAFGIMPQTCWARSWLLSRRAAGLHTSVNGTLVPAIDKSGFWLNVAFSTPEFAAALRGTLIRNGIAAEALVNIGAHSLKCTCLSWAAKHGMNRDHRRLLGYHVAPGDRSMETYSRDVMATPLRALAAVVEDIMKLKFKPDATRSGTFATAPRSSSRSTSSSSRSPSSAACSADDAITDVEDLPEGDKGKLIMNTATSYVHISKDASMLCCGKSYPFKQKVLAELPVDARLCPRCF